MFGEKVVYKTSTKKLIYEFVLLKDTRLIIFGVRAEIAAFMPFRLQYNKFDSHTSSFSEKTKSSTHALVLVRLKISGVTPFVLALFYRALILSVTYQRQLHAGIASYSR